MRRWRAARLIGRSTPLHGFTDMTRARSGTRRDQPRPELPAHAVWYSALPRLAIYLTLLGFNLVGDGLRDLLDPKSRG